MKLRAVLCAVAVSGLLSQVASAESAKGSAKENAKKAGGKEAEMQAKMAAMEKAGTPGEQHKMLQRMVGKWSVASKMWMDPAQPVMESKGTADVKSILGDRFVQMTYSSTFMGQPFNGIGINGYDNTKKKFVGTWVDSMGTGIMSMEGTADAAGNMTSTAKFMDCTTGKEGHMRIVHKWENDSKFVEEFYEKRGGKEVKSMEMTYTKAK